jgi:hypothetical protein
MSLFGFQSETNLAHRCLVTQPDNINENAAITLIEISAPLFDLIVAYKFCQDSTGGDEVRHSSPGIVGRGNNNSILFDYFLSK